MTSTKAREKNAAVFAARLKKLREEAGLTMVELAARCGMRRHHLAALEGGGSPCGPSWVIVCDLANALGVGVEEFCRPKKES